MAQFDARTRSKTALKPARILQTSVPTSLLYTLLTSNLFHVLALFTVKEWLLAQGFAASWIVMRLFACAFFGVIFREGVVGGELVHNEISDWPTLVASCVLLVVQQISLMVALAHMSATRLIVFSNLSNFSLNTLLNRASIRQSIVIIATFFLSLLLDARFSAGQLKFVIPSYIALAVHALSTAALEHTSSVLAQTLKFITSRSAGLIGASLIVLPVVGLKELLWDDFETPAAPFTSFLSLPLLAFASLWLSPVTAQRVSEVSSPRHHFVSSFGSTFIFAATLAPLAFSESTSWSDLIVGSLLFYGMYPQDIHNLAGVPRTPTSRLIRTYLKTILDHSESRRIFYFLMLNMSFMVVQMLYGVWTNSLGLISDAIHMAFDCMAIGVGLIASVMATWPANEKFTYGYTRIETLSGFANGIFLVLISIFIVFEAIQRLLEPPQMNTNQLLLISSIGLGVNLFGMFAMGGHHHGHSHSHGGHSHGSSGSHSHNPVPSPSPHSHSDAHSHLHTRADISSPTSHSHSNSPSITEPDSDFPHSPTHEHHSHSHSLTREHQSYSHSHTHANHFYSHQRNASRADSPLRLQNGKGTSLAPPIDDGLISPITPSYRFDRDEHYEAHHTHSSHAPNLHAPHQYPVEHEGHSHNMRGVFLHVLADTLGSVGVIISTLLIKWYGWTGFDPIASLFIAILIAASVIPLILDAGKILSLDMGEQDSQVRRALTELSSVPGVAGYTMPRFWPGDSGTVFGMIHVQLASSAASFDPTGPHSSVRAGTVNVDRVVEAVDSLLRSRIRGLEELTIQVEKQF